MKRNKYGRKYWKVVLLVSICSVLIICGILYENLGRQNTAPEKSMGTISQVLEEVGEEKNAEAEQKLPEDIKETKKAKEKTSLEESNTTNRKETEKNKDSQKVEANATTKKETAKKKSLTKGQTEKTEQPQKNQKETKGEEKTKQPQTLKKEEYVPIPEGWKDAKSVKGDISENQKAYLDSMIENWKNGTVSDSELKDSIMNYLKEQNIKYVEVSVTSQGYALYEKAPEIALSNGGNLYSFVGTYSTGKQNPDGTDKTIFYNWTVFVF